MTQLWSELAQQISPYVPGEQLPLKHLLKLNTNESPFGPSPLALNAIAAATGDSLRLYPDPTSFELRAALSSYHDVAPEAIIVGNGSDEILAHTFAALLKQPVPLRFPDITYNFYPVYCQLLNIQYETVALGEDFSIRVSDYLDQPGPIIIANPNAPTGIALSRTEIELLASTRTESVVVVDEAYVDFGAESAIELIHEFPNLLVVRTMSKSRGLAGLRVGYAVGNPSLIEAVSRIKDSFNSYPLDRLAQAAAIGSLLDEPYFQKTRSVVIENRGALTKALLTLGFEVLPSSANFVFARHNVHSALSLTNALREDAILVRHFDAERISNFLRITVGDAQGLDQLRRTLAKILSSAPV